ncbi:MAG TPA: ATP-binding protein [Microbacterium sp.]|uniref:sensor histidine kinase n=1 Tax=Microbacterium sp. TaxID=51671 RepID=UPI002B485BED|nr:ATP-binding protein [Microbacterium sp.]HKT55879.1 ATP-binding protein [Microbacterium sp.]
MSAADDTVGGVQAEPLSAIDLGTFTRSRVERSMAIVIGFGCAMLGAQGFVAALGGGESADAWHPALEIMVFVPLAVMIVACFVGRFTKLFGSIFAVVGVVAIALWPFLTGPIPPTQLDEPWPFFLINVITVAAVLAFPLGWQIAWTAFVPLEWMTVRLIQFEFAPQALPLLLLDTSFALVFGSILLTLGWLFRRAASTVDHRRAIADAAYAEAIAADAAEQERLAVGALMHDSVLSALIAAARAYSRRERELAVSMASEALTRLANTEQDAEVGPDAPVALDVIAQQLERAAVHLGSPISVSSPATGTVPGGVARALALAGVQAISNAIEHAHAAGLAASITATYEPLQVTVTVVDAGEGFVAEEVPEDRLGISASIVARMAAVGGRAQIDSGADGTAVTLTWSESEREEL